MRTRKRSDVSTRSNGFTRARLDPTGGPCSTVSLVPLTPIGGAQSCALKLELLFDPRFRLRCWRRGSKREKVIALDYRSCSITERGGTGKVKILYHRRNQSQRCTALKTSQQPFATLLRNPRSSNDPPPRYNPRHNSRHQSTSTHHMTQNRHSHSRRASSTCHSRRSRSRSGGWVDNVATWDEERRW